MATFNAILESEVLDEDGRTLRTMRVSRFRRVDDQWIVRQVDVTDEHTRDRTRFEVVAGGGGGGGGLWWVSIGCRKCSIRNDWTNLSRPCLPEG